jgi:hypothetical protein
VIFIFVAAILNGVLGIAIEGLSFRPICLLYVLGMFIPGLAVTVRRLHDTGKSGWWILINLIPFGSIVIIIFMLLNGENGGNAYGPDPRDEEGADATSVYVPQSEFIEIPVNAAVLSALKCPQCDSKDYIPLGKKGAAGKALATQIFIGGVGNIISARSDAKSVSSEPLQYKCKKCKSKYLAEPSESTPEEHLSEPCRITLQRIANMVGAALPQVVYLNGIKVGTVKNGKAISFNTRVRENVVFVTVQGVAFPDACKFTAEPGGSTVILFNRKVKQVYKLPKPMPNKSAKSNETTSESYFGLSVTSSDRLQYLGHYENIELEGDEMPYFISSLTEKLPDTHHLIVPQFGLLIIIKDKNNYTAFKFKSPMSQNKASEYMASIIAKGQKMKTIEKYGAFEFNY